jgi:hypothetical protein
VKNGFDAHPLSDHIMFRNHWAKVVNLNLEMLHPLENFHGFLLAVEMQFSGATGTVKHSLPGDLFFK